MLFTQPNEFNWNASNVGSTFTDTGMGTQLTAGGTNHTKNATPTSLLAAIAEDCYWISILFTGGATSGASARFLTDIYVDPGGGTPPSDLTVEFNDDACGSPEVDLVWAAGSGSGNYTVERKLGSGGSWSTLSGAIATTSYTDTALTPSGTSRTYYYRVKQNDVTGYSNSESTWIPKC